VDDAFHQLIDILGAAVGQFRFRQSPNALVRVDPTSPLIGLIFARSER
jgi:hypothetical protein